MSDIKIQPSATGSATVTLTAPATSTARTVTLPDSTDTLAVNSDVTNKLPLAGGTLTGAVSLTGGDLVIDQTNNGYSGLRIHDDSGGDYNSYIDLGRNQGGTRLSIRKGGRVQGTSPWQNATPDVIVSFANEGIAFHGDTAAANTLDDYEEGNWTPTLTGSGTISHSVGKYVKIGNQIMVQGEIRSTSYNNSGATDVLIGGLPYSSFNENNYNFAANITPISGFNLASDHGIVGYMSPNQSHINLFGLNQSAGANYDVLQQGEMGTTVEVFFAVHYRTN